MKLYFQTWKEVLSTTFVEADSMKSPGMAWMIGVCGAMLLALGACGDDSPTAPRPGHLSLSVGLSSTNPAAGERVDLTLTVLNDGGAPVELVFGDSCRADFTVVSDGGVVWNALAEVFCLQSVTKSSLAPGEAFVFREAWDQSRNDGGKVNPGSYRVFGTLRASEQPSSPSVTLTVR